MPHTAYLDLVREAREDKWFPHYERRNALGEMGILLEILILGALRYLGRGWTFDDLYEATSVSTSSETFVASNRSSKVQPRPK